MAYLFCGDPYVYADELHLRRALHRGKSFTPGVTPEFTTDGIVVGEVLDPDLTAAGLIEGAVIIALDGKTGRRGLMEAWLAAEPGPFVLDARHDGTTQRFTSNRLPLRHTSLVWSTHRNVAYVRIDRFSRDTMIELRRVYRRLMREELRGLILDLRSNPGGTTSYDLIDCFFKPGVPIVTIQGTVGHDPETIEAGFEYYPWPLVVVVDRHTTSMAEPQHSDEEQIDRSLPAQVMTAAEQSDLSYSLGVLSEGDAQRFFEKESRRYRRHLDLDGGERVTAKDAKQALTNPNSLAGSRALLPVLRVHLPGDPEWARTIDLFKRFGQGYRDLAPEPPLPIAIDGGKRQVTVQTDLGGAWMLYALAKAVWRYEPGFAAQLGVGRSDRPSVIEELVAWSTLMQAYANSQQAEPGDEAPPSDSYLDSVVGIGEGGDLLGFVLFEVVHKTYGVPLDRLTTGENEALQRYLYSYVLPLTGDSVG